MPVSHRFIVVMGVSGSGKSTLGAMLAGRLAWDFVEGDDLHPPANIEKMRHGIPLDDQDREPWLEQIAGVIRQWAAHQQSGIVACSALKSSYRDIITAGRDDVLFLYLKGSKRQLTTRLTQRLGHFMPPSLLETQLSTLEEPKPGEPVLTVRLGPKPDILVEKVIAQLHLSKRPQSVRANEDISGSRAVHADASEPDFA